MSEVGCYLYGRRFVGGWLYVRLSTQTVWGYEIIAKLDEGDDLDRFGHRATFGDAVVHLHELAETRGWRLEPEELAGWN